MIAKLRSCCRIAAPVGGSAAWPTSEEPARIAVRAAQNGTFPRISRRSAEDVIGDSHDSTAAVLHGWRDVEQRPGSHQNLTQALTKGEAARHGSALLGAEAGPSRWLTGGIIGGICTLVPLWHPCFHWSWADPCLGSSVGCAVHARSMQPWSSSSSPSSRSLAS